MKISSRSWPWLLLLVGAVSIGLSWYLGASGVFWLGLGLFLFGLIFALEGRGSGRSRGGVAGSGAILGAGVHDRPEAGGPVDSGGFGGGDGGGGGG